MKLVKFQKFNELNISLVNNAASKTKSFGTSVPRFTTGLCGGAGVVPAVECVQ